MRTGLVFIAVLLYMPCTQTEARTAPRFLPLSEIRSPPAEESSVRQNPEVSAELPDIPPYAIRYEKRYVLTFSVAEQFLSQIPDAPDRAPLHPAPDIIRLRKSP